MIGAAIACSIVLEPQLGLDYGAQLAAARAAEDAGLHAFYRSDHYTTPFMTPRPVWTDAWTTLAGLARETRTIALGTMVSPVTFRHAGVLAATVATAQAMSGGRVVLGLGAGWDEAEHGAFGIPFPALPERMRLLGSQLDSIRAVWERPGGPVPRPPIVIGGQGGARSRAMAVKGADGYNVLRAGPEKAARINASLDEECRAIDRDPRTLRRSALVGCLIGLDQRSYRERRTALAHILGLGDALDPWLEERAAFWVHGGIPELQATLHAYGEAGCDEVVLEIFDGTELGLIEDVGRAASASDAR